jgi:hypothetical protein
MILFWILDFRFWIEPERTRNCLLTADPSTLLGTGERRCTRIKKGKGARRKVKGELSPSRQKREWKQESEENNFVMVVMMISP